MKEENGSTKRLVLKFADGIGTYVGEAAWTFEYALRKASHDLGIEPKAWQAAERTETKKTVTIQVVRKAAAPPAMKTVYGDIEPETPAPAVALSPGFQIVEPLTGIRLNTHNLPKEEPFEPVTVTIGIKSMLAALKVVADITSKKTIMPILTNVRIATTETEAILSATDLEKAWQITLKSEGGSITRCIPASVLTAEVKALPAETAKVELLFKSNTVSVNGRCDINTQDADEFPEINCPPYEGPTVGNLGNALKRVMPAVSRDETRYTLTGVFFDFPNSMLVGTDGFRLHMEDIVPDEAEKANHPAIVPLASANIMAKYDANACAWLDEKHLYCPLTGGVFSTRVIEDTYPDWKAVKPNPPQTITFDPAEFLKIVEGAMAIASDSRIDLTVNGSLIIQSDGGSGVYKWQMPCSAVLKERVSFTFNPRYLTEAMKAFPAESVTLQVPETYGACLVNEKAVVMPIRV